eukprot:UN21453
MVFFNVFWSKFYILKIHKNYPFLTPKFKFYSSSMQIDYFGKKSENLKSNIVGKM